LYWVEAMSIVRAWKYVLLGAFAVVALLPFIGMVAYGLVTALSPAGGDAAWRLLGGFLLITAVLVGGTTAVVRWFGGSPNETLFGGLLMLVIVCAGAVFLAIAPWV
jgi:hypothetical protein